VALATEAISPGQHPLFQHPLPRHNGCHQPCGSNRPKNPSALAVLLVFALAFLFVIPRRREGICFCSCSTTDRSAPYATVRHSSSEAPLRLAPPGSKNKSSKVGMFFDKKNHHARTTQNTTIYHQFTTFYQTKTTSNSPYPQTLAL
jgi:hypothetical protein